MLKIIFLPLLLTIPVVSRAKTTLLPAYCSAVQQQSPKDLAMQCPQEKQNQVNTATLASIKNFLKFENENNFRQALRGQAIKLTNMKRLSLQQFFHLPLTKNYKLNNCTKRLPHPLPLNRNEETKARQMYIGIQLINTLLIHSITKQKRETLVELNNKIYNLPPSFNQLTFHEQTRLRRKIITEAQAERQTKLHILNGQLDSMEASVPLLLNQGQPTSMVKHFLHYFPKGFAKKFHTALMHGKIKNFLEKNTSILAQAIDRAQKHEWEALKRVATHKVHALEESILHLCKNRSLKLFHYPKLVEHLLRSECQTNKVQCNQHKLAYCRLLKKFPQDTNDPKLINSIGVALSGIGIFLQVIPGIGNGVGAISLAIGSTITFSTNIYKFSAAYAKVETASALNQINQYSFESLEEDRTIRNSAGMKAIVSTVGVKTAISALTKPKVAAEAATLKTKDSLFNRIKKTDKMHHGFEEIYTGIEHLYRWSF